MARLRAPHALLLLPLAIAVSASFLGCNEKMKAEQRAEEAEKQKAAASASAAAAASAPDPKEELYAKSVKAVRERAVAHMTALQRLYQSGTDADQKAFREWFPDTPEGLKDADEISKEAAFTGKEGMSIKRFDVQDVNFDATVTTGTTDVFVEESQRGKPRCTIYKLDWKQSGGAWRRVARRDFRIVPCE